jgi:hypothetical protein
MLMNTEAFSQNMNFISLLSNVSHLQNIMYCDLVVFLRKTKLCINGYLNLVVLVFVFCFLNFKGKKKHGDEGVTQVVECLPSKCEALSSSPVPHTHTQL